MSYKKRSNREIEYAHSGYDNFPYSEFKTAGFDWIPLVNWLRLCPFNETTKRWHVPMRHHRTNAVYWTVYKWMRNHEWDYQHNISRAMGEHRGLFSDDAQEGNFKDYWLVADYGRRIDLSLIGDPDIIGVKTAPVIRAPNDPEHAKIPDINGNWVYSTKITKEQKGMDDELRASLDAAYKALNSMGEKTMYMRTGDAKYF